MRSPTSRREGPAIRPDAEPQWWSGEETFRGLLEAAPDAIVIVSEAGRIVLVNTQAESLFGYPRDEILGEGVEVLIPDAFRRAHRAHRDAYIAEPRVRRMGEGLTLYGRRRNGSEFPVEISLSPLQTTHGRLITAAIRDVTERQNVERALAEKNVELELANQTKDRFLATMSHELRTPLNAIIGFTGTLLMRLPGPLTADQQQQLETVQTSGRHLLALINDLLDLARIGSGKMNLHIEDVDCRAVVQEAAGSLAPSAWAKGLEFAFGCDQGDVVLHTDRRALSQIVLNLASNAIKFTSAGSVRIESTHGESGPEIAVIDTGPGVREEDRSRLFQAFQQFDTTAGQEHGGTGLGLHLSQQLASELRMEIVFEPTTGGGSTFRVRKQGAP